MKMKKEMQRIYTPPTVNVSRVVLESGFAQVKCSVSITVADWEDDPSDTPATNNQDIYLSW